MYTEEQREKRRQQRREWYARNRERELLKAKKIGKLRYEKNRESILERQKDYHQSNRARIAKRQKSYWLLKKYGLTEVGFQELLTKQAGKCAICKRQFEAGSGKRSLHVDHCHSTGKVRGLLCSICNKALGMFDDDEAMLDSAIAYLGLSR